MLSMAMLLTISEAAIARIDSDHLLKGSVPFISRNDIVDLMDKINKYRKNSMLKAKMKEIRSSFDGLLLKIIALLEGDPSLSRDLYVGRESIWESLLEVKA